MIAFPVESAYGPPQNWWEELAGALAEQVADQRPQRTRVESGTFAGINLELTIDPTRIQWTAQPAINLENPPEGLPLMGPFPERRRWFVPLMQRWLATSPPLSRLGFVATLHQPVDNRHEGYRRLDRYLRHVEVDPENSDSFLYRINRRRVSGAVPGLAINRLTTWAAMKLVSARGLFTIGSGAPVQTQQEQAEWNSCFLELDINTAPDFSGGALPPDRLALLLAELADMGEEIATRGDVRQ